MATPWVLGARVSVPTRTGRISGPGALLGAAGATGRYPRVMYEELARSVVMACMNENCPVRSMLSIVRAVTVHEQRSNSGQMAPRGYLGQDVLIGHSGWVGASDGS